MTSANWLLLYKEGRVIILQKKEYFCTEIFKLMKSFALFGASGRTGTYILKKALDKGYHVNALVRDPEKLQVKHDNLRVVKGDVMNQDDVENTIRSTRGVISVIGHVNGSPADIQERAINNIIRGMNKHRVHRLISLTGGAVRSYDDRPKRMDGLFLFVMKKFQGELLRDAINHTNTIRNTNLDWTIVRAPRLTMKPGNNRWKVGNVGTVKGLSISREDLAGFILSEYEKGDYVFQMPFVTHG